MEKLHCLGDGSLWRRFREQLVNRLSALPHHETARVFQGVTRDQLIDPPSVLFKFFDHFTKQKTGAEQVAFRLRYLQQIDHLVPAHRQRRLSLGTTGSGFYRASFGRELTARCAAADGCMLRTDCGRLYLYRPTARKTQLSAPKRLLK